MRVRSETFADHYSQARQFYMSQAEVEQMHIAAALTFELSKVETTAIRARMVSHLLNIDEGLAKKVAGGLGVQPMPAPAEAAKPTRTDLPPSPALSIVGNCPGTFRGRKLGVLVTEGSDADLVSGFREAVAAEGAMLEVVAPTAGGVKASNGAWIDADHMVGGGPSVLFDAVAILPSAAGAETLMGEASARDFAADAFAHRKFIAYVPAASKLIEKAGIPNGLDDGFVDVSGGVSPQRFIELCRRLRHWPRETGVKAM